MMPSWQEILPIVIILIVIFGARKLPEIGSGLGKGVKEFKKSIKDIEEDNDKKDAEEKDKSKVVEAEEVPKDKKGA